MKEKKELEREKELKKEQAIEEEFVSKSVFQEFIKALNENIEELRQVVVDFRVDIEELKEESRIRREKETGKSDGMYVPIEQRSEKISVPKNILDLLKPTDTAVYTETPQDFEQAIHQTLTPEFGTVLFMFTDSPDMYFGIVVPEKYSNRSEQEKKAFEYDVRGRVIPKIQGVHGVKEWAMRVRANLTHKFKEAGVLGI